MISPAETWNLDTTLLAKTVHVHDRLDSTNTHALSLATDPANHGLAIVAREQSAGRGQYGRSWQAPAGSSVLLTLLVFPPPHLCRPVMLTAWAAVSVCESVRTITGRTPRIKWPNDVLVSNQKICGILIEQRATSSGQVAAAVGIGLNVRQPRDWFDAAGLPDATSLSCLGAEVDAESTTRRLLCTLDDEYSTLADPGSLEARWASYLALTNCNVVAEFHDGHALHGELLEAGFDGILLRVDGEARILVPETIKHLTMGQAAGLP